MTIELDTTQQTLDRLKNAPPVLNMEELRANAIRLAGAHPIGERGGLVWFTDLRTKTTLVLHPEEVSVARVREKLATSRKQFPEHPPVDTPPSHDTPRAA